ncbi:MAG: hypothetical protein ACRCZS_13315 [Chroococcidiopsis sp.]
MKIEHFPGFTCTIDESTGTITASVVPWENCEYIPASVGRDYNHARHFPFSVKFLARPKDNFFSRTSIAVRTDIYPLLWVYVWLHLQIENLAYIAWCFFMWECNRLGLAKTELGSRPSLRDFKINKFQIIAFIANIICTLGTVSLFKTGQPILGCIWFLLFWFLQYKILQKIDHRRKLVEELKELDRQALLRLQAIAENANPIISYRKNSDCNNCKYYYGRNSIVCAVHPSGYKGATCKDRCDG